MTTYKIEEVEGIGPVYAQKLIAAGVKTTDDFLKVCADQKGRDKVAKDTGISATHLLKWANMADLMRIDGVGKQFAELLEGAGVDTVKELRNRRADNLATKMAEVNEKKKLCKVNPSEKEISDWITQAKAMTPLITH